MDLQSTSQVREELAWEEELAAARLLERQTEERHGREGSAETEAVLGARRTRAGHLEGERGRLVAEIGQRTIAEGGGTPGTPGPVGALPGRVFSVPAPMVRHDQEAPQATTEGADESMCYTRRDRSLDEEARRPKVEEDRRRRAAKTRTAGGEREKTPTEKAKEMVGAR